MRILDIVKLAAVGCAALSLAGCAGSPVAIKKMTADELVGVGTPELCHAYASYYGNPVTVPNIAAEVKKRKLTCAEQLEHYVSDCSQLRLVRAQPHPTYSNVTLFTVTSTSAKAKDFNVLMPGDIMSSKFTILPNTTGNYGASMDALTATYGAIKSATSGSSGSTLVNCLTSW